MAKKTPPFEPYPEWTEARFFQFLRSALRQAFTKWPPKHKKVEKAKAKSSNKRYKWRYRCESCGKYYPKKEIEVDHKVEAGSLKQFSDLPGFAERLFCGEEGLQILCKTCHNNKSKEVKG